MKKQFVKLIAAAMLVCFASSVFAQENAGKTKQTKPVVMILGAYHMGNPGRDLGNVKADDVRSEKRQKEIAEVVAALRKFRPTRVAVEIPDEKYVERYAQYLDGKYALAANEVDQIGFRLAKEMNLKRVYTIDWQGNFDFDKVLASAKANNQQSVAENFMTTGKTEAGKQSELLKTATVGEVFRYLNDEKRMDEWHKSYLSLLRVGAGTDYAGADLLRDWYERNLKIYANIGRLADSPNERIFVIIGAGHLKLLQQFVEDSGEFELEQANKYL
jgi:hypothetical protein